jgi:erythromycin esterase-like protein
MPSDVGVVADAVRRAAHPLDGGAHDHDRLLEMIGDARLVLLGESTHGTHEFYRERARITRRLVEEKGFTTIAVEADWPDAYRVNRYVRGLSDDASAIEALGDFGRFPLWMWRNTEVVGLVEWLHARNASRGEGEPAVGFYGMDLYSMYSSIEAVLGFLDRADPEAARRARHRYACFEHFGEDSQAYGYAAGSGMSESCEEQAVQQLVELQRRASDLAARDGAIPEDEFFFAEQNARLVKNAEEYYRSMFRGRVSSWNLRDRHMVETLDALVSHFDARAAAPTRMVVWAHNSHLGDARATEMGRAGEWNVGQLVRERYGGDAFLVGFTTANGTVTAATDWEEPAQRRRVREPLPGSYEEVFQTVGEPAFLLGLRGGGGAVEALRSPRLERAIGVIYRPEMERVSHYFTATLPEQFDAVLHFDRTRGLEPLDLDSGWEHDEAPDTFPFGL